MLVKAVGGPGDLLLLAAAVTPGLGGDVLEVVLGSTDPAGSHSYLTAALPIALAPPLGVLLTVLFAVPCAVFVTDKPGGVPPVFVLPTPELFRPVGSEISGTTPPFCYT